MLRKSNSIYLGVEHLREILVALAEPTFEYSLRIANNGSMVIIDVWTVITGLAREFLHAEGSGTCYSDMKHKIISTVWR